jgi:Bacterial alpha-L-rhamnosidase concanavalin-like domain
MKKTFALIFLAVAASAVTNGQVISWNDNNGYTIPGTGTAGVVAATNWNNSNPGSDGGLSALSDSTGAATSAGFTVTGTYGGWGIGGATGPDADGTYNKFLLGGYANTSSGVSGGVEVFSISGIPYSAYNVIVYFSSDTTNRTGTIACANAGITYDFTTIGPASVSGTSALLVQTTDTTGANPPADYAIFSNLTGGSQTLTLSIPNGGGIAGFQIEPTSASSANVHVYDLGQNATLMPQLQVSGPAGSYVRIIPSELLGANGLVDRTTCVQSTPPPPAWWQYTLRGTGKETWMPQFFIQGCRYLQVQLFPAPGGNILPTIQSLQGVAVHSTSTPIGKFSCSNPLFNQI